MNRPCAAWRLAVVLLSAGAAAALAGGASAAPQSGAAVAAVAPPAKTYASSWDEYQAMKAAAHGGTRKTFKDLPDWTGVWTHDHGFNFDPEQKGELATADLTPEYKAKYLKKLDNVKKGIEWDPLSACLPAGYPRWIVEPFLKEFIVRPEEVWAINEAEDEVRRIYTDGRGHMPEDEAYPLWEGDSIGFWDGDTLVVHTNHLRAGQYQRLQPDYSDQVSTVERITRIGPNTIEDVVDVYDPPALKTPWHVRHTYTKVTDPPDLRINQWVCEENNNAATTANGSTTLILPGEPGYRDPNDLNAHEITHPPAQGGAGQ